jgi:hypothetical protein
MFCPPILPADDESVNTSASGDAVSSYGNSGNLRFGVIRWGRGAFSLHTANGTKNQKGTSMFAVWMRKLEGTTWGKWFRIYETEEGGKAANYLRYAVSNPSDAQKADEREYKMTWAK